MRILHALKHVWTVIDPAFFMLGFPRLFCLCKHKLNHPKFRKQKWRAMKATCLSPKKETKIYNSPIILIRNIWACLNCLSNKFLNDPSQKRCFQTSQDLGCRLTLARQEVARLRERLGHMAKARKTLKRRVEALVDPRETKDGHRVMGWMVSHLEIDWMMSLEFFGGSKIWMNDEDFSLDEFFLWGFANWQGFHWKKWVD